MSLRRSPAGLSFIALGASCLCWRGAGALPGAGMAVAGCGMRLRAAGLQQARFFGASAAATSKRVLVSLPPRAAPGAPVHGPLSRAVAHGSGAHRVCCGLCMGVTRSRLALWPEQGQVHTARPERSIWPDGCCERRPEVEFRLARHWVCVRLSFSALSGRLRSCSAAGSHTCLLDLRIVDAYLWLCLISHACGLCAGVRWRRHS